MKVVVIGASFGGMKALKTILQALPSNFGAPILIVQHINPQAKGFLEQYLNSSCDLEVKEADEKEQIQAGHVYYAPPNYHMLVDQSGQISFTVEQKENYARPSIDILFHSAVDAFGAEVIGVILTGANADGSKGLKYIVDSGGIAIVQDPQEAEANSMPKAAIAITKVNHVLPLLNISKILIQLIG